MNKALLPFLLFLFFSVSSLGQQTKRAFFIGNSYTYGNNLPGIINSLANSNNDTLIHSSSTPGGAQLVQHVVNSSTLNGIRQGNWDFVIIQEQSQKPSFSPGQVANDVLPYAAQLNDTIEKYNPCGETAFFMTWGRKNGDASNCASYPPICTYTGMQDRLRSSYLLMAQQNNAICSPVGAAWKVVRDSFPTIELYNPDESHPSYAGSYLAACTFYAAMFRKSPAGLTFYGSLSASDAQALQNVAASVVLDSLSNWYIGDYDVAADFSFLTTLDSVSFTNNSSNAVTYNWDFGDSSASSSLASPSHVYDSSGTYHVTLEASDSCGNSLTFTQDVLVSIPTQTAKFVNNDHYLKVYPNPASGIVTIESNEEINVIKLLNSLGQEILSLESFNKHKKVLYLELYTEGIYIVYAKTSSGRITLNKLVLQ